MWGFDAIARCPHLYSTYPTICYGFNHEHEVVAASSTFSSKEQDWHSGISRGSRTAFTICLSALATLFILKMAYHKATLVGAACLFLGSSAGLIPRAESWTVALDPIQAIINQDQDGKLSFDCQAQGRTVISASNIGLQTSGGDIGPQFTSCKAQEQTLDRIEYSIPLGRSTNRAATYRTQSLDCQTANGSDVQFDVRVGVDGCAWRLKVPNGQYEVTGETSKWIFAQNGETYLVCLSPRLSSSGADKMDRWMIPKTRHTRANGFAAMWHKAFRVLDVS